MRAVAFAAFFLSGASSLIFQSIWSRMLHHVFGATGVAISTVVTAFMIGLGLGAFLAGRVVDRTKHPILTYAVFEGLVGLCALAIPFLVSIEGALAHVNAWLHASFGAGSLGLTIGRFLFVLPILLVPTTLMGASLPLLARHFVERGRGEKEVGAWVGALYAVNTFGAVVGVLAAAFLLMPTVGLAATNYVAVGANLGLCLLIVILRRPLLGDRWKEGEPLEWLPRLRAAPKAPAEDEPSKKTDSPASDDPEVRVPATRFARIAAVVAFGVSGAAALCSEVVWTRALAMTIGSSVYSFSLILATFLVGIAGGSALSSAVLAGGRRVVLAVAATAIALVALANAPWASSQASVGESFGLTWPLVTALFSLPILLLAVGVYARRDSKPSPWITVLMLTVPISAAAINAALFDGPLPPITAATTIAIALFPIGLVLLRPYPVLQLAVVQLFIAVATFVNFVFQDEIPCAFAALVNGVGKLDQSISLVQFLMFFTAALCTLPATLGMGAMFPLTLRLFTKGGGTVGRDVGVVYGSNTVGSIFGAWLPGFVLMQWFGVEETLLTGIVLNLLLTLLLLVATTTDDAPGAEAAKAPATPRFYVPAIYGLAVAIPLLVALLYVGAFREGGVFRWNKARMSLGVFRMSSIDSACDWPEPDDIPYYADGLSTTVSVERVGGHYALKNNGKVDASNGDDMPTQVLVAAYPLLFHPRGARDLDVAVVGFGSGVSVGTALKFPVRSVRAIELERNILEASRFFSEFNDLSYPLTEFPFVQMDRLTVVNDDGRNYLASTSRQFDVIVSEPSNPWITGVSDLFTVDHFRLTKRRLREGGIYCQWVQLYELSPENIKTIYRTFASQYRHVLVLAADVMSTDTILLGSDSPIPLDLARIERGYGYEGIAEELRRARIESPYDVFSRVVLGSRNEVLRYARIASVLRGDAWRPEPKLTVAGEGCGEGCRVAPAPLNTDDNMLIEFAAPRDLIGYSAYENYVAELYELDWPFGRLEGHLQGFGRGAVASSRYARLAYALMAAAREEEAGAFLTRAEDEAPTPDSLLAAAVFGYLYDPRAEPPIRIETPTPRPELARGEARHLEEGFQAAREAADRGAYATALAALRELPSALLTRSGPGLRFLHAYLLVKTSDRSRENADEAVGKLEDLVREDPNYVARRPEVYYVLARAHRDAGDFAAAVETMRMFVENRLEETGAAPEENSPTDPGLPATVTNP